MPLAYVRLSPVSVGDLLGGLFGFRRRRKRPQPTEPRFDPAKLIRIRVALERRGVAFLIGDDGERLARTQGAEALYLPIVGQPGWVVLAANPSRAAVIEELIHLGQHRRLRWPEPNDRRRPHLEIEAQDRLLALGRRKGWTRQELRRIRLARAYWVGEARAGGSSL